MYAPQPYKEGYLPVEDGHCVYYAEFGQVDGPVIVSVHGGPGSQSKPKHAALFDLTRYRVVLFDQRGCGKSTPAGEVADNTTAHIVSDMERLRTTLGVPRWFVAGSSWGSAVALVYAETFPEVVAGLLLSAVFLADETTDTWAFANGDGVARLFPDGWKEWQTGLERLGLTQLSRTEQQQQLYELICQGTAKQRAAVAALMNNWEVNLLSRNIPVQFRRAEDMTDADIFSTTIFLHYQVNKYFLELQQIEQALDRLGTVPIIIVHGRYDVLCPPAGAMAVAMRVAVAEVVWLPESHHVFSGDGAVARMYVFRDFLNQHAIST